MADTSLCQCKLGGLWSAKPSVASSSPHISGCCINSQCLLGTRSDMVPGSLEQWFPVFPSSSALLPIQVFCLFFLSLCHLLGFFFIHGFSQQCFQESFTSKICKYSWKAKGAVHHCLICARIFYSLLFLDSAFWGVGNEDGKRPDNERSDLLSWAKGWSIFDTNEPLILISSAPNPPLCSVTLF